MLVDYLVDSVTPVSSDTTQSITANINELSNQGAPNQPDAELPHYEIRSSTSSREQTEHVYSLSKGDNQPWLTMKIKSWAPSVKNLPMFRESETMSGIAQIDLRKPEKIKAVVASVVGQVTCSKIDIKKFFVREQVLYDATSAEAQSMRDKSGKLVGSFSWPFTFKLEGKFTVEPAMSEKLRLLKEEAFPPNFRDKAGHASLDYKISVEVKRSGLLNVDEIVTTMIGFSPFTVPGEPSIMRGLAYQENSPVPGPDFDPTGWKSFPEIEISGTIFKTRKFTMFCTPSLAEPMCYTRGSAIPCFLTFRSSDIQALDLLSNPEAPVLQMRRKVKHYAGVDNMGARLALPGADDAIPLSRAVWAPPKSVDLGDGIETRMMYGELNLPSNLVPTFKFGDFEIKYMVDMYAPEISGFVTNQNSRLFRTEVRIASSFVRGPRPRTYLPPGYVIPREKEASRRVNGERPTGLWSSST